MIDHIAISVADLARARNFYDHALAPLGITMIMEVTAEETGSGSHVGFGTGHHPFFWIGDGKPAGVAAHIAFQAESPAQVDAFYQAALAAGGRDNGRPGLRAHYHPSYYGAFVFDPDGNNIEAVCHKPA